MIRRSAADDERTGSSSLPSGHVQIGPPARRVWLTEVAPKSETAVVRISSGALGAVFRRFRPKLDGWNPPRWFQFPTEENVSHGNPAASYHGASVAQG
jgi:hypothetical protein